jgi:hypothetical protein
MKHLFYSLALITLTTSAFAGSIVKTCDTKMLLEDKMIPTLIKISSSNGKYTSEMIEVIDGKEAIFKDEVLVNEFDVSAKAFTIDIESPQIDKLNAGERYIVHALAMTSDPEMKDTMSAGLNLLKVRHVRIYELQGEENDMFKVAIIEAKDMSGRDLGSFFGGFLVSPCKK